MVMDNKQITCLEEKNKEKIIYSFYDDEDDNWHKIVHKNKGDVDSNVADTFSEMKDDDTPMYLVKWGDEIVGFFGYYEDESGKALVGFHIGKKFRTKDFIPLFWEEVKKVFKTTFFIAIFEENIPAINHLKKQGCEIVNKLEIDLKEYYILQLKF
jgi:RimJ/RimL family protein N-acetyltransferase